MKKERLECLKSSVGHVKGLITEYILLQPDGDTTLDSTSLRTLCKNAWLKYQDAVVTQLKKTTYYTEQVTNGAKASLQADAIGYATFEDDTFYSAIKKYLEGEQKKNKIDVALLNRANESIDSVVYKSANDAYSEKRDSIDGLGDDGEKSLYFARRPIPIISYNGRQVPGGYDNLHTQLYRYCLSILRYTDIKTLDGLINSLATFIKDENSDLGKAIAQEIQNKTSWYTAESKAVGELRVLLAKFISRDEKVQDVLNLDSEIRKGEQALEAMREQARKEIYEKCSALPTNEAVEAIAALQGEHVTKFKEALNTLQEYCQDYEVFTLDDSCRLICNALSPKISEMLKNAPLTEDQKKQAYSALKLGDTIKERIEQKKQHTNKLLRMEENWKNCQKLQNQLHREDEYVEFTQKLDAEAKLENAVRHACKTYRSKSMFQFTPWSYSSVSKLLLECSIVLALIVVNTLCKFCIGSDALSTIYNLCTSMLQSEGVAPAAA